MTARDVTRLTDFYDPRWFVGQEGSTIWIRIFSSLAVPHSNFKSLLTGIIRKAPLFQPPVCIAFGDFGGLKIPTTKFASQYADERGGTVIEIAADLRPLPKSNYVSFSTPCKTDGGAADELRARRTIDLVSALVRVHFGANFLRDAVVEGELALESGKWNVASEWTKIPQLSEGPFINEGNWNDVCEIADATAKTPKEVAGRLGLAMEYLQRAFYDDEPFFSYWTSLNILCKGKNWQAIREKLRKCYGLKSSTEAELKTGIKILGKWRNDFYHDGLKPFLGADIERYLQLMILDLVRFDLRLPIRGHLVGIQSAKGYDLSRLGLRDNRTDEQKRTSS